MTLHTCRVEEVTVVRRRGWKVTCATCGPVTEQAHEGDARAIADRHEEVGGFEHPTDDAPYADTDADLGRQMLGRLKRRGLGEAR